LCCAKISDRQISNDKKRNVSKALQGFREGDAVRAKIIKIDLEKGKMNFGIKPKYFNDNEEEEEDDEEDEDDEEEENGLELKSDNEEEEALDGEMDEDDEGDDDEEAEDDDEDVDVSHEKLLFCGR
jgi:rRNA biogenesis protein RRP5